MTRSPATRVALPLAALVALLALAACGGADTGPKGHDELHASCFQLVEGRAAGLTGAAFDVADVEAPAPSPAPPAPTRRWSDAAAWPGGAPPEAGDHVTVPAGDVLLLDVSPPPLASLTVHGALVFDRQDLELAAGSITVTGGLYVGSAAEPFTHRAVITLGGPERSDAASDCFGRAYLGLVHGTLEAYGDPTGPAWTRLAATAPAGATSIALDDAGGLRAGDRIVIASTDFYAFGERDGVAVDRHLEERTVTAVDGHVVTLDAPLEHAHHGERLTFGAHTGYPTTVLEARAEVARLTRNVTIRGAPETRDPRSEVHRFGGHVMALGSSRLRLDSVELTALGQAGELMRYPVHFHLMGDAAFGSFVRNASLHHLYNRCITIHGSRGVLLEGNAAYDTFGHCYFLEDGAETANVLKGNLGMMARAPAPHQVLIPTDASHQGPSIFWITNPDNVLVGNVAASSQGSGFWYSLPEHPTGPSFDVFDGANVWPRRTPLGRFEGNLAHSNAADGLHVDRGPRAGSLAAETTAYRPRTDPADRGSAPVTARFEGFVAYKHRSAAAWFRGDHTLLTGALLVDNAVGATFASDASGLERSVVVGESSDRGTADPWEATGAGGRPLPRPWDPGFAIRGFEFYDGPVFVRDTYFEGYAPDAGRQAAALSFLDHTDFSLSPLSYAEGLSFAPGTQAVWFETREAAEQPTDDGEDGYRSGLFLDRDGSVTGAAGTAVTVDNPLLVTEACSYRSDWNARTCAGRYASLTLRDTGEPARGLAPVGLLRGADPSAAGPTHTMHGTPHAGPNVHFRTLLPLGHDYHYRFDRGAPDAFTLELAAARPGDALLVSLPYTGAAPYVYRDWWIDARSLVPAYASLAALRAADGPGLHHDGARLWLKLQVQDPGGDGRDWAHLTVCRRVGC